MNEGCDRRNGRRKCAVTCQTKSSHAGQDHEVAEVADASLIMELETLGTMMILEHRSLWGLRALTMATIHQVTLSRQLLGSMIFQVGLLMLSHGSTQLSRPVVLSPLRRHLTQQQQSRSRSRRRHLTRQQQSRHHCLLLDWLGLAGSKLIRKKCFLCQGAKSDTTVSQTCWWHTAATRSMAIAENRGL
jgi:hypothetical protein